MTLTTLTTFEGDEGFQFFFGSPESPYHKSILPSETPPPEAGRSDRVSG